MKRVMPMSMRGMRAVVIAGVRMASVAIMGAAVAAVMSGCGSDDWDVKTDPDGEVRTFNLEFFVESAGEFGALQLEVTHLGESGGFTGHGDLVDCVALVEAIVASNYAGERVLKVGMISLAGIRTPAAILRCGFRTSEEPTPADFLIEVLDASDTESKPLDPAPTTVISTITPR